MVEIRDANGALVPGATNSIEVSLAFGTGKLTGTRSVKASAGRAVFTDLTYRGTGPLALRFRTTGLEAAVSDTIYVAAQTLTLDSTIFVLRSSPGAIPAGEFVFDLNGAAPLIDSGMVVVIPQVNVAARVIAVKSTPGSITLKTAPAGIEELGIVGTFTDSIVFSDDESTSPRTRHGANTTTNANLFPALKIPNVKLGFAGSVTASASISASFTGYLKPVATLDKWGRLSDASLNFSGSVTITGQVDVTATGAVSVSAKVPLFNGLCVQLGSIPGCFKPTVNLVGNLKTVGTLSRSEGFTATGTFQGAVTWDRASGFGTTHDASVSFSLFRRVAASIDSELTVSLMPGIAWSFYGLFGASVEAGPYARATERVDFIQNRLDRVCEWGLALTGGIKIISVTGPPLSFSKSLESPFGIFCRQSFPLTGPGTLIYSDDFSGGLGNWIEKDPDGLGSWIIQNGELVGDYNIGCGTPGCHQNQLILADQFQPTGNWRMEVRSGLQQAYCCYNGGAMVNLAKFVLYIDDNHKEQIQVGGFWQGLTVPASTDSANAAHAFYPWTEIANTWFKVVPWSPAAWQNAALEKRGDTYTAYFNGVALYSVTRTFPSPPKVGFSTYGAVRMDDFKLYSIP